MNSINTPYCALCDVCSYLGVPAVCDHAGNSVSGRIVRHKQSSMSAAALTDCSFYTARTSATTLYTGSKNNSSSSSSSSVASTVSSSNTLRAISSTTTIPPRRTPSLRKIASPTTTTLRELHQHHLEELLVRNQRSDDRLRDLYEAQTSEYLASPVADLDCFAKRLTAAT